MCAIDGKLEPATWPRGLRRDRRQGQGDRPERIGAIAGDLASVEEMFALKALMDKLGVVNLDCRQDGSTLDPKLAAPPISSIRPSPAIDQADAILIDRLQPAPRGAGAQRPHPQALAARAIA